jgi:hypothetical protein
LSPGSWNWEWAWRLGCVTTIAGTIDYACLIPRPNSVPVPFPARQCQSHSQPFSTMLAAGSDKCH